MIELSFRIFENPWRTVSRWYRVVQHGCVSMDIHNPMVEIPAPSETIGDSCRGARRQSLVGRGRAAPQRLRWWCPALESKEPSLDHPILFFLERIAYLLFSCVFGKIWYTIVFVDADWMAYRMLHTKILYQERRIFPSMYRYVCDSAISSSYDSTVRIISRTAQNSKNH